MIAFRFVPSGFDMKVVELMPGKRVLWEVVDGPAEWIGAHVSFDLRQEGDFTIVLFAHRGWAEPVEFMSHCSTKWAVYLLSLKQLLETGQGTPTPPTCRSATGTERVRAPTPAGLASSSRGLHR